MDEDAVMDDLVMIAKSIGHAFHLDSCSNSHRWTNCPRCECMYRTQHLGVEHESCGHYYKQIFCEAFWKRPRRRAAFPTTSVNRDINRGGHFLLTEVVKKRLAKSIY
jgi:hypothetical protein